MTKSGSASRRDEWYEKKKETERLFAATPPVRGTFPLERLQAARSGVSGHFHREWIGKFPIVLKQRDAGFRREVDFEVTTWAGMSLGAVHYYAEVTEDTDEIFVPK